MSKENKDQGLDSFGKKFIRDVVTSSINAYNKGPEYWKSKIGTGDDFMYRMFLKGYILDFNQVGKSTGIFLNED